MSKHLVYHSEQQPRAVLMLFSRGGRLRGEISMEKPGAGNNPPWEAVSVSLHSAEYEITPEAVQHNRGPRLNPPPHPSAETQTWPA